MNILEPMSSREEYERGEETDYMSEEEYEDYCIRQAENARLAADMPEGIVTYFEDDIPF